MAMIPETLDDLKQLDINFKHVPDKTTVHVRGKLAYARLVNPIVEGTKEFNEANQRAIARKLYPKTKTYRTLTLYEPRFASPAGATDQSGVTYEADGSFSFDYEKLSDLEKYILSQFYVAKPKNSEKSEIAFKRDDTSKYPPVFYQLNPDNKTVTQIKPTSEFAKGLDVTLIYEIYSVNNYKGLGLRGVLINEPVRYYESNPVDSLVSALGLVVDHSADPIENAEDTSAEHVEATSVTSVNVDENGVPTAINKAIQDGLGNQTTGQTIMVDPDGDSSAPWDA